MACLLAATQTTASPSLPEKLTCSSTVFEPYVIEDNGRIYGVDVEMIQEVGRRLGIDIEFTLVPWKRLEQDVKHGSASCVAAYFSTPDRRAYMDFTRVPLHITSYALFVNKEKDIEYQGFEAIRDWSVGVNRGFKTTPEFERAVYEKRIRVVELGSTEQGFEMLRRGRIEAVLTNLHVGQYLSAKSFQNILVPLKPSLSSIPAYFVFSKQQGLAHLVPLFDETLMNAMTDGTYQKIFNRYTQ